MSVSFGINVFTGIVASVHLYNGLLSKCFRRAPNTAFVGGEKIVLIQICFHKHVIGRKRGGQKREASNKSSDVQRPKGNRVGSLQGHKCRRTEFRYRVKLDM